MPVREEEGQVAVVALAAMARAVVAVAALDTARDTRT